MPVRDLDLLTEAARAAGHIAERYWRRDPATWDKPGHQGPVTEADLEIDRMLHDRLRAARPAYGWLSEESEDDPARLEAEHIFVVDPIDGTRAFIGGERTFAHALAVARSGAITAAVVYLPMMGALYQATVGGGAWLNGRRLCASSRDRLEGAAVLTARAALDPDHWTGPPPHLKRSLRASLAYRLCLVAEGRYDAMLTLRDSWDWDTAAGSLIAREAGASVTDRRGGALRFDTAHPVSAGVIAAPPALHGQIVTRLA
ncbi:inositol monophosphatase family protein [Rhodovulum adriaticum]|uniref:Myo-inositol-1(Or 4)-monophosphatase n=1 Tax=Rhodovulum adriaticum TaxID=35804 RepID=A0A4R2NZL8_RHOAD|nr:3'(2'),5'-bisphosphate nucleotidase CysQ [Rhodovulum adriaticum]MBK1634239.1 3'(2'),5'-bisphosphate nucleotidase CysQ [Rhodovulum adriaticum]TCP27208.1 myo-inositol-1(or 4)-monophosphatase [Rhodovulum adriaticum]